MPRNPHHGCHRVTRRVGLVTPMTLKTLGIAIVIAMLITGCAALTPKTVIVDRTGRDLAKVDADILACWQQAEAAHPLSARRLLVAVALGPAGSVVDDAITGDGKDRRDRVQRTADVCMEARGYTVVKRSPS
jgi:hypothetical protein